MSALRPRWLAASVPAQWCYLPVRAKTRGPFHLTMDVNDAIETAHAFPDAVIVPVHCDGWAHFTQSRDDIKKSFDTFGLASRLRLLEPGVGAVI